MQPMERFFQRRRAISLAGGILLLLLLAASAASAATEIFNVRHWAAPDHTRVVFDATEEPSYTVEREEALLRIVIRDAALSASLPGVMAIEKPGVRNILLSTSESQVTIELALSGHTGANIFSLSRIQDKPHRLVIDVLLPETKKKEAGESEASVPPLRKRIVVLDPGHGGEAPGAVGRAGTQEKDVVLGIAKMTRENLNRKPGYRAILTRDGDYYVSFRKRMQTARDNNADLFVSIHADASRSRRARGSSVYTLSLRGASSEAARLLAKSENLADVIGGSPAGESADESDPIVLNMFQTNSINRSKSYGQILLQHLDDVGAQFGHPVRAGEAQVARPDVQHLDDVLRFQDLGVEPAPADARPVAPVAAADRQAGLGHQGEHALLHASLGQRDSKNGGSGIGCHEASCSTSGPRCPARPASRRRARGPATSARQGTLRLSACPPSGMRMMVPGIALARRNHGATLATRRPAVKRTARGPAPP